MRFESGVLDLHSIAGAGSSIDLLAKVGVASIEARTLYLSAKLAEGLAARGWILVSARTDERERSPIIVFRHASLDANACYSRLTEGGVIVSLREGLLRASPHFYNNEDDIDRLLDALP
jgi:selenocysteine lyase/cysteine desulfurase